MTRLRDWPRSGVLFVLVVTALAFVAWRDPNHVQRETELASIGLTLPAFIPSVVVVYPVLAASRNVFHPSEGGPTWPVTGVYVTVFAGLAVLEVWVVRRVRAGRNMARNPNGETLRGYRD